MAVAFQVVVGTYEKTLLGWEALDNSTGDYEPGAITLCTHLTCRWCCYFAHPLLCPAAARGVCEGGRRTRQVARKRLVRRVHQVCLSAALALVHTQSL